MSGGGRRSVGPPISKFWSDLWTPGEQMHVSDREIYGPLSLGTPVPIRWDLEVTKRIPLGAELLLSLQVKRKKLGEKADLGEPRNSP